MKGLPFWSKVVYSRGKGLDLGAEHPRTELVKYSLDRFR